MKTKNLLSQILSSHVRAELFRLLFDPLSTPLHMRELERQSNLAIGTIQQDLKKLSALHLITSKRDGNRLYYKANTNHPLFYDIQNLVIKTTGAVPLIAKAFTSEKVTEDEIVSAFIFGSMARNEENDQSDLDLIVVGSIGLRKLSSLLSGISNKIGREINPHIFSTSDYKKKVLNKDHFLTQVLSTKRTFIIGSEDELKAMVR